MTPDGHPTYHLTQAALREPDLTITPTTPLINGPNVHKILSKLYVETPA